MGCLVYCFNRVISSVGGFTPVLVTVASQKSWHRGRATAQSISGPVRHKKRTNTSNGLRASTIVGDNKKWAFAVLGEKSVRGRIFQLTALDKKKGAKKTCIFLQPARLHCRVARNDMYMTYVLSEFLLSHRVALWELRQKKVIAFLGCFQSYLGHCTSGSFEIFCVFRHGKEEHSESFASLVRKLMPWSCLFSIFLSSSHCLCCFLCPMGEHLLQYTFCSFLL